MARIVRPTWKWTTRFAAPVAALILLIVFIGPARAIPISDPFELDSTSDGANAISQVHDDWDHVCHQVVEPTDTTDTAACTTTSNTTGATAVSWNDDGNLNATIFTGGGSKDPSDVTAWLWKDGAGGLPDKDNLRHSFAARYSVPSSTSCPSASGNTDGTENCDMLYFGMDRYDNAGDAQLGFWFFQNSVTADGPKSGGGNQFTGTHKAGDVLILSDFSNGGTTSTIKLYKWVDSGGDVSTHLESLAAGENRSCDLAASTSSFCGMVNKVSATSPWPFVGKGGNTSFAPGELFEGGVNLSAFPELTGECFASFGSESRSSTSPTATLKDFVLGGFGSCTTGISTTQKWVPRDEATITVTGKATWTGTVTFTLYNNATCDPGVADANVLWTSNGLTASNATPTVKTVDASSQPAAIGTSGSYGWKVAFASGTSGVPDQSSTCDETTDLTITN